MIRAPGERWQRIARICTKQHSIREIRCQSRPKRNEEQTITHQHTEQQPQKAWRGALRAARRWLTLHRGLVILAAALFLGGVWIFAEVTDEIYEADPEVSQIDRRILLALREKGDVDDPIGSPLVESTIRDITALGGPAVLAILTAAGAGFLLLRGQRRAALALLAAMGGAFLISQGVKLILARPRPLLATLSQPIETYSFPSGHAMVSAATYLTLGRMLSARRRRWVENLFILGGAALLIVLIGLSRVYLGVHWPTDVVAGWAGGVSWALFVWWGERRFM